MKLVEISGEKIIIDLKVKIGVEKNYIVKNCREIKVGVLMEGNMCNYNVNRKIC